MTGAMNGLSGDYLEARIDELVVRVGMTEAVDRRAGTYSKGMKQRLGIADHPHQGPRCAHHGRAHQRHRSGRHA